MLTRAVNSFSTITQQFNFAGNPGALRLRDQVRQGRVAAARRQPLLAGAARTATSTRATGKVELIGAREPGDVHDRRPRQVRRLLLAVEPRRSNFNLIAPFDLSSRTLPGLTAGRATRSAAIVGEPSAGGRVTVAVAKGKNGKKFRTLGKGKVNSKGIFKVRFTPPQARHLPPALLVRGLRDRRQGHGLRGRQDPPHARLARAGRFGSRVRGRGCR